MVKRLSVLAFLVVAGYLATLQWPSIIPWVKAEFARAGGGAAPKGDDAAPGDGPAPAPGGSSPFSWSPGSNQRATPVGPPVMAWGERNVGGLRVALPVAVQIYNPPEAKAPPANVTVENYKGQTGNRVFYVAHATSSTAVGTPMLAWADGPLANAATRLHMQIISKNTATTLINGLRARRSDYVTATGNPRVRARCVLLERASSIWFIECHAPENDAEAENIFLKIAYSAQSP